MSTSESKCLLSKWMDKTVHQFSVGKKNILMLCRICINTDHYIIILNLILSYKLYFLYLGFHFMLPVIHEIKSSCAPQGGRIWINPKWSWTPFHHPQPCPHSTLQSTLSLKVPEKIIFVSVQLSFLFKILPHTSVSPFWNYRDHWNMFGVLHL